MKLKLNDFLRQYVESYEYLGYNEFEFKLTMKPIDMIRIKATKIKNKPFYRAEMNYQIKPANWGSFFTITNNNTDPRQAVTMCLVEFCGRYNESEFLINKSYKK